MRTRLLPEGVEAPGGGPVGDYVLEPFVLTEETAHLDWVVLHASIEEILKQRREGMIPGWPGEFTYMDNLKDLAWLDLCREYGQLFPYIMWNDRGGGHEYAGFAYVYPIELKYPRYAGKFDVDFSFWLSKGEFTEERYQNTFDALMGWMDAEWPFPASRVGVRNLRDCFTRSEVDQQKLPALQGLDVILLGRHGQLGTEPQL